MSLSLKNDVTLSIIGQIKSVGTIRATQTLPTTDPTYKQHTSTISISSNTEFNNYRLKHKHKHGKIVALT